ncbi:hypothetical protein DAMA08_015400 [Martiniozyma asiatica (nom. inval.)]|nr:hypothetical protein DAMA08_015400 [Martiniozyma asiatica]
MFSKLSQLAQAKPDTGTAQRLLHTDTPEIDEITQPNEIQNTMAQSRTPTPTSTPMPTPTPTPIPLDSITGLDENQLDQLKSRLAKFSKYDKLYPRLYDAYKIEKKKTSIIDQFETVLKEFTPLIGISDVDGFKFYLQERQNKFEIMSKEIKTLNEEITTLKGKVGEMGKLEWKVREGDVEMRKTKKQVQELKKEKEQWLKIKDELTKEKDSLLDYKITKEKELITIANSQSINQTVSENENDSHNKENIQANEITNTNDNNEQLSILRKQKQELKVSVKNLEEEKKVLSLKIASLETEKEEILASTKVESKHTEKQGQKESQLPLVNVDQSLSNELATLRSTVKVKEEEIEELKDMLKDVGSTLVETKENSKSAADFERKAHQLQIEVDEKKNELEILRLQNSNALTDYEKTKASLTKKYEEVLNQLEDSFKRIKQLTNENQELSKKVEVLDTQLKKVSLSEVKLSGQANSLIKEKDKLKAQLESMNKAKSTDENIKLELTNLKNTLSRKEKILSETENRVKYLQEEKNKLNDSLIELKVQSKQLIGKESEYDQMKGKLSELNEKLHKDVTEGNIQLNKVILERNKLIKRVEELEDQYNDVKDFNSSSNEIVDELKKKN